MENKELFFKNLDQYILDNYIEELTCEIKGNVQSDNKYKIGSYDAQYRRYGNIDEADYPNPICGAPKDRSLEEMLKHTGDTFQEELFTLIDNKGLSDVEVYNRAHIDRKLFSKIRSNVNYVPKKKTALCLCIGAKLNIDEATDLLMKAGFCFSSSDKVDIVVRYFIENEEYDLMSINEYLNDNNLPLLNV